MAGRNMIYVCDGVVGARSLGSKSIVSFEDVNDGKRSHRPFFLPFDDCNNVDEECDEYFHQPEKKRRLAIDQVQFLEKSFEIENKLEPERKVKLAKDLGLQPRQVAIWFQNRRARWKSKQLEKDYDVLQSSYNNLKADYEGLLAEKEKLNTEVLHLREKLLLQQNGNTDSDESDTDKLLKSPSQGPIDQSLSEGENSGNPAGGYKLEDISSAKRDVFEADQSDLSQDEEDNFNKNILAPSVYVFPKIEDDHYHYPTTYSGYYGFPVEDQALEFYPY